MGFGLVLAGFILLFNPMIHVIDLIPDVIGFMLIAAGLRKTSFFISRIDDARRLFWKLVLIEAAKLVSVFMIPYGSLVPHHRGSTQVLLTFVFLVLEFIAFIPAVNYLFEGISFAGVKFGANLMYEPTVKKHLTVESYEKKSEDGKKRAGIRLVRRARKVELITATKNFIIAFFIFRNVMTLIPELTELEMYEFVGNVSALSRPLTDYKPFLYVISFISVTVFGIIYIKRLRRFFRSVKEDERVLSGLKEKFERDIMPRKTLFMSLDVKLSIILFAFAVGASFVFHVDGVNILVGCISAGFLIAAAIILGRHVKLAKLSVPFSVLRAGLAIYNVYLEVIYASEYGDPMAVEFIERAADMYYTLAAFKAVEASLACVSIVIFIISLIIAVKKHLPLCGVTVETVQYSKQSRDREIYDLIKGRLIGACVLTLVSFATAAAHLYCLVYLEPMIVISTAVTIVWVVYTIYSANLANSHLYNREIDIS